MKNLYPYFSQNPLDRMEHFRANKEKILELMKTENSLFTLFDGMNIIINKNTKTIFFDKSILENINIDEKEIVLLGKYEDKIYFALTVKENLDKQLTKVPLREFAMNLYLDEQYLGIIAQGSSVLNWHETHKFCSSCGESTFMVRSGWRRDCKVCKKEHFPRVDSVVIMLVTYDDYCLLGRGVNFKEGRYSCLAGYMESGESLEEAAKREVFEESAVECYDVEYVSSQPWPFPTTLMVGMKMKAKSQDLTLDEHEIADAIWVHKNDVKAVLEGSDEFSFTLPDKIAIARNLLEHWVYEEN